MVCIGSVGIFILTKTKCFRDLFLLWIFQVYREDLNGINVPNSVYSTYRRSVNWTKRIWYVSNIFAGQILLRPPLFNATARQIFSGRKLRKKL